METEIKNLFKVWIIVFTSLIFCRFVVRKLPKGKTRLVSLIPIITLFTLLPLNLSTIHCVGITTFFITWLANFKLLLFAFNQGPLSPRSLTSLLSFIFIACFPIKIKDELPEQHHLTSQYGLETENQEAPCRKTFEKGLKSPLNYAIKELLLALIINSYKYKQYMNKHLILALHCCHIYSGAEVVLAMIVALIQALRGVEIELQFNEPYLSSSLQVFWGRRWNLMVTSMKY